jgi:uncharacterized membrane protein
MAFWLVLITIAVVWLIIRQRRGNVDRRQIDDLLQQMTRLEQRMATFERRTMPAAREGAVPVPPTAKPAEQYAPAGVVPHPSVPGPAFIPPPAAPWIPPPPQPPAPTFMPGPIARAATYAPPGTVPAVNRPAPQARPEPPKHSASLEERLGANWLNKLGIVILVIGVSLFLAYRLRTMGPQGKAAVGCVLSLGILVAGVLLERSSRYRVFARAAIGGGWALTFFVAYALYHVAAMQVISSQLVDLVLMIVVAFGMVWHSLRYKSQVVTSLAFLLAFLTVGISHVTLFSLVTGALLAAGLVYVVAREYWFELGLAGLVGVYLNHFLWLLRVLPEGGRPGHPFPEFAASAGLLLFYWFIFRLAYVLRAPRSRKEELLSSATAVLNSAGLMGLLKYQSSHPEWAFRGLLALGAAEMLWALFTWKRRRPAFIVLSTIASVLLLAAIPFHFSGSNWSLFWLLEAEVLFVAGVRLREPVFRRLGLLAGFATAIQLLAIGLAPILETGPSGHASRPLAIAIALLTGALIFWANAHLVPRHWPESIEHEVDRIALTMTSYAALLTAAVGLWLFFPNAWTAVAWMVAVVALGYAADRLASADLATQADLLAFLAILRLASINVELTTHWGVFSQRGVTVGLSAALFYAGMRRKMRARLLPAAAIPVVYSWVGAGLLGLLLWYGLRPISVAVSWGVLGLVFFELGFLLRRSYLRQQGYALLVASAIRIFFVNLNAGGTSHLNSPRVYTILPLVAAYLWVYERVHERQQRAEEASRVDRVMGIAAAWAAPVVLAALAYFELDSEWVCVAWAALVLVAILAGWFLRRPIFVAQSMVLLLAVFARATLFNLFSAPPISSAFWNGRTASIAATSVVLLLALPVAFSIRNRARELPVQSRGKFSWIVDHPEQGMFFAPLVLLTLFLAVQMRAGMITISWSALGVVVFLFALLVKERSFRLAGLGLLLLGVGKIICIDIWHAAPSDRYITLIVMGASLLLISFLYTRYREAILKLL